MGTMYILIKLKIEMEEYTMRLLSHTTLGVGCSCHTAGSAAPGEGRCLPFLVYC